jgi:anti-sigma factor RsiW
VKAERPVDQSDLHAYADGLLAPDRAGEVARHLADHPADMASVSAWVAQNRALRDAFDTTLSEPLPRRLAVAWLDRRVAVERMSRPSGLAFLAAGSLALGAALGASVTWLALAPPPQIPAVSPVVPALVEEAVSAHIVFAGDEMRPVELGAADAGFLATWFARRLGSGVAIPDLSGSGLSLLGGRLVSGADGASAVVLYRTPGNAKLSLVASRARGQPDSEPSLRRSGPLLTVWWVKAQTGYAVTAALPEPTIRAVSHEIRMAQPTAAGALEP